MRIAEVEIPHSVIAEANEFLNKFIHCEKKPNVIIANSGTGWLIEGAMCQLEDNQNRGMVGSFCDACKIKKETGKYPGEDFNPLDYFVGMPHEDVPFEHRAKGKN